MERRGGGGGGGLSTLPTYVMTIIQIFYALVCICGLVGNSLVIYVVLRWDNQTNISGLPSSILLPGSLKCIQLPTLIFFISLWLMSVSWWEFLSWSRPWHSESGPSAWPCARSTSPPPPSTRSPAPCSWWCSQLTDMLRCVIPYHLPGSELESLLRLSVSQCGWCQVEIS